MPDVLGTKPQIYRHSFDSVHSHLSTTKSNEQWLNSRLTFDIIFFCIILYKVTEKNCCYFLVPTFIKFASSTNFKTADKKVFSFFKEVSKEDKTGVSVND